jgi:hypothetical protein
MTGQLVRFENSRTSPPRQESDTKRQQNNSEKDTKAPQLIEFFRRNKISF